MDIGVLVSGMVDVELTCADPAATMSLLYKLGIPIYNASREDEDIVIHFQVQRKDFRKLNALVKKKGYRLRLMRRFGLYWSARMALTRPILLLGLLVFIIVTMY